jgi:hypothetical protein
LPAITLVYVSSRVTVTVADAIPFAKTIAGLATTVDCSDDAGPGPDGVKLLLVADDSPGDDALKVYDAVSSPPKVQFEIWTTPCTAVRLVHDDRTPPPEDASEIVADDVVTLPPESSMSTTGSVEKTEPAGPAIGWTAKIN